MVATEPEVFEHERRNRRRGHLLFAAVGIASIVAVIAAVLVGGGGGDPAEELERTLAFADSHVTARYDVLYSTEFRSMGDEGLGNSGSSKAREEGVLMLPGTSAGTVRDGTTVTEVVVLPDGEYMRYAERGDDLAGEQWSYSPASDIVRHGIVDLSVGDVSIMQGAAMATMGGFGVGMAGAALGSLGAPAEVIEQLHKLDRVERLDGDTIRGHLDPSRMFGAGAAEMAKMANLSMTIDITTGPGDSLDEIVVRTLMESKESLSPDDDESVMPFGGVGTVDISATIRFSEWGAPVEINIPDPATIDLTPGIEEEDLAGFTSFPLYTVGERPTGWSLTTAWIEPYDEEFESCERVYFSYHDVPAMEVAESAGEHADYPPDLSVTVTAASCDDEMDDYDHDEPGEDITVGGRPAKVWTDSYGPDEPNYTTVAIVIGNSRVEVASDLPRDEVLRYAANLVPFDLASQPVHRVAPPPPPVSTPVPAPRPVP